MDFDSIEGIELSGYRLASIDLITPSSTSGDAYLLCPDGQQIDLYWRSEQPKPLATWSPPTTPGSLGVITVEVCGSIEAEADLGPVLEAAVPLIERVWNATHGPTPSSTA